MESTMKTTVSIVSHSDRTVWEGLYYEYAHFYKVPMNQAILDTVWQWICDDNNPFWGFIAKNEIGDALGLAHCREMPSPLRGAVIGFLDDIYIQPAYRGSGCVQEVYEELKRIGKERSWPFIRWITAENNYRGRASYDKLAEKTHWVTYQMAIDSVK